MILIVTGHLAAPTIKKIAKSSKKDVMVHIANTQVAAFLTPKKIIKELKENFKGNLNEIEKIIVPGLMKKPTTEISESLKIPCFKGPIQGADLDMVLDLDETIELSQIKPADRLIEEAKRNLVFKLIEDFEKNEEKIVELLKKPDNILIRDLPVGEDFPIRILCEITNAPLLSKEELIFKAKYFLDNGADMIDIGMVAGENMSHLIPDLIKTLRTVVGNKPLSIDSLNPKEINVAIDNDIDLVLSLDLGNYEEILPKLIDKDIPAVLLPTNFKENKVPTGVEDRLIAIEELMEKCEGIAILGDIILDPVNSKSIVDSIIAAKKFKDKHPNPLFFGVGNVTELMDVDSTGVNSLITGIAMELKASVLFTPDESGKTWNSVYELAISSKMMFLSKNRGTIPKNLGIDLITFKDKKKLSFDKTIEYKALNNEINNGTETGNYEKENDDKNNDKTKKIIGRNGENLNVPVYSAEKNPKFKKDQLGSFKIRVEHGTRYDKSKIVVTHYVKTIPNLIIEGTSAKKIFNEIIERGLISKLEHGAYLGVELNKAEIAILFSKDYIQDFELFKKPLIIN
ncbi:MAG: dihydropteroate synthase-like protein [Methanobrevibacter sp.]|jgi:dihydropteroate synthase-like protein|nr:dihydropteroate synthase-like protein [Candidatus Methanovirga australis]